MVPQQVQQVVQQYYLQAAIEYINGQVVVQSRLDSTKTSIFE
jgi:hypothetical protein